jgi:uncharacterized protein (TIGR00369 family)
MLDLAQRMVRGETPPPPVARTIGFTLESVEPGSAVISFVADENRHANPMGTLHGGILCDIADAAMGLAFAASLDEGESFTTIELKMSFFRAIQNGRLTATSRVVHAGRSIGFLECDVVDDRAQLIARASSTCVRLRTAAR